MAFSALFTDVGGWKEGEGGYLPAVCVCFVFMCVLKEYLDDLGLDHIAC